MSVQPVPPGYHTLTPYLIVSDCAAALDYYKKAFGATEVMRMPGPGGKIVHAEIKIGDSFIMLADENPGRGAKSPRTLGGSPVGLCLYLPNVDAVYAAALAAGGKEVFPLKNQFYGDRSGTLTDPFGHNWTVSTHVEDVSPEEMQRRAEAAMKEMPSGH